MAGPGTFDDDSLGVKEGVASCGYSIDVERPPGERRQHENRCERRLREPPPGNEAARRRALKAPKHTYALRDHELPREPELALELLGGLKRGEQGRLFGGHQAERAVAAELK